MKELLRMLLWGICKDWKSHSIADYPASKIGICVKCGKEFKSDWRRKLV